MTTATLKKEAAALADPERARFLQRFFRTGIGALPSSAHLLNFARDESFGSPVVNNYAISPI